MNGIRILIADDPSRGQIGGAAMAVPRCKIAQRLSLGPKTVEKHRVNILNKLGLENLVARVKYAVHLGLVDSDLRPT